MSCKRHASRSEDSSSSRPGRAEKDAAGAKKNPFVVAVAFMLAFLATGHFRGARRREGSPAPLCLGLTGGDAEPVDLPHAPVSARY